VGSNPSLVISTAMQLAFVASLQSTKSKEKIGYKIYFTISCKRNCCKILLFFIYKLNRHIVINCNFIKYYKSYRNGVYIMCLYVVSTCNNIIVIYIIRCPVIYLYTYVHYLVNLKPLQWCNQYVSDNCMDYGSNLKEFHLYRTETR
jgi:hypothetical protein